MYFCNNYALAVFFCVVTMFCWGSWGNAQKLAGGKNWRYELFYWDYVIGVWLFSVLSGLTVGSWGGGAWSFLENLKQASGANVGSALVGGVVFNAANMLLAAAISIAGMSVAFPVGIGLALVLGVVVNYLRAASTGATTGDPLLLFGGVAVVVAAILCNAFAYRLKAARDVRTHAPKAGRTLVRGLVLSVVCGILMAFFYDFVAKTMDMNFTAAAPRDGMMTPYSAFFVFACGVFASTFVFNAIAMRKPVDGTPITERDYFRGGFTVHLAGVLGGLVWGLGNGINLVAAGKAGTAISYGLGQGATLVSALWGILIWKEFKDAPSKAAVLNALMFVLFLAGLALIVAAGN
ncbi:MAG: multidrug DMT transporter permease [Kiritimatiellia bacterium]